MDVELNRLNSFGRQWRSSGKTNALTLLASAGFYYTGRADEVKCFACQETFRNWDVDDSPYGVHLILNQDCPFIVGQQISAAPEINSSDSVLNMQLRFSHKGNFSNGGLLHQIRNSDQIKVFPCPDSRFHFESRRIDSFQNLENRQELEKFAAAGFYYNAENCSLVCAFCKNEIPLSDSDCCSACVLHRNQFPDCPFICGIDVGNVSVRSEERIREKITANRQKHSKVVKRLDFTAIDSLPCSFPEYTEEVNRVQSFKIWPKHFASDLPQALSEAGFFYLGFGDMVACFCCKLTLCDWKARDRPMVKHLEKKPDCPYMVMIIENNITVVDNMDMNSDGDAEMLSQSSETSDIDSSMSETTSESDSCEATTSDQQDSGCEQSDCELDFSPGSKFGWRFKTYMDPEVRRYAQKKGYTPEQIENGIIAFFKMSSGFYPDALALAVTIEKNLDSTKRIDELRSSLHKVMTERRKELDVYRVQYTQQLQNKDQQWRQEVQNKDQQWRQEVQNKDQQLREKDQQWRQEVQNKDQMLQKATQNNNQLTQNVNQLTQKVEQVVDENSQLKAMLAELMRENQQLRNGDNKELIEECDNLKKKAQCKVCLNYELGSVLLPCKHLVCCQSCSVSLMEGTKRCPTCRASIAQSVDVYLS